MYVVVKCAVPSGVCLTCGGGGRFDGRLQRLRSNRDKDYKGRKKFNELIVKNQEGTN